MQIIKLTVLKTMHNKCTKIRIFKCTMNVQKTFPKLKKYILILNVNKNDMNKICENSSDMNLKS